MLHFIKYLFLQLSELKKFFFFLIVWDSMIIIKPIGNGDKGMKLHFRMWKIVLEMCLTC